MPSVPDTTGRFFIMPAQVENLHNVKYVPDPYDVAISDTILEHGSVALSWRDDLHGTFDVFWRKMGEQQWRKVNELPYAPPFRVDQEDADVIFEHSPVWSVSTSMPCVPMIPLATSRLILRPTRCSSPT